MSLLLYCSCAEVLPQRALALSGEVSASAYGFSTGNSGGANATALQKALNSGSQVVTISSGAFNIGPSMVTVPAGVTLQGASGTQLNPVSGTVGVLDMLSNSTAQNITFNCSAATPPSTDGVGNKEFAGIINVGTPDSNASGVLIKNCTVNNSTMVGVFLRNATTPNPPKQSTPSTVEGCTFDMDYYGVVAVSFYNIHVYRNTVKHSKSAGMMFWGNDRHGSNWVARETGNVDCEYNTVIDTGRDVIDAPGAAGIWCSGCKNVIFNHNRVDGVRDGGLDMEWTCQGQMCDNTISGAPYGGIAMFYSSEDIVIANNHITNDRQSAHNGDINAGIYLAWPNTNPKSDGGFERDFGYKNVTIYHNTIDNIGAWKQRAIFINCNTTTNIKCFDNTFKGRDPNVDFGSPTKQTTDNIVLNNMTPVPLSTSQAEIGNAGFEMPAVPAGRSAQAPTDTFQQFCTFTGTAGIASNGSGLGNPSAPDGTQAGYIQGKSSISQQVWFPKGKWSVSFSAAQTASKDQSLRVLIDGKSLGDYVPAESFTTYSTSLVSLKEGSHVVTFQGHNEKSGAGIAFIDKISFTDALRLTR